MKISPSVTDSIVLFVDSFFFRETVTPVTNILQIILFENSNKDVTGSFKS